MTKSTITRELVHWLHDAATEFASTKLKMTMKPDEVLALTGALLASMDTEPVAYTDERNLGYIDRGRETAYLWGKQNSEASDVALYRHAQPAPVVPEEATPDSIEILASARRRDRAVFQWDEDQRNAAADSWNACRAAMLAAAPQSPGSEPATVPGKWIPVSEQMPIDFEAVIAFDGDQVYGEAMYSSDDGFTIDGYEPCDRLKLQNVTHWMPLPAAPQEVKGE